MTVTNRVWDPTAVAFVSWRTGRQDITGIEYPGPDAFGNTSDYNVTQGVVGEPPVEAQLHNLLHAPVGLWQLDGGRVDSSPTGDNLTLVAGTEQYGPGIAPGIRAAYFDGVTRLAGSSPGPAALRILGDVTLELLVRPQQLANGTFGSQLAEFSGSDTSSSEIQNFLYQLRLQNDLNNPSSFWEDGAGGLNFHIDTDFVMEPGRWHHMAMVRTNGGAGATTGELFVNGTLVSTVATFDEPTGGGDSFIKIGQFDDLNGAFFGFIQSVKVIPSALTAAEVLAEARLTLPPSVRP